jgi:RimJ/RimL family protein N-acetyltransferase
MQTLRRAGLHRLRCDSWVRYHRALNELPPLPEPVALKPVDAGLMERLRDHPERNEPQLRSAWRFWRGGFARGYAWMEQSDPLCIMWVMNSLDDVERRQLDIWAGMYPALPAGVGVTEGLYTFRRALRRRGGAATPFTLAVLHEVRRLGLNEIRTHIHVGNIAAHRWAQRIGLRPYGMVHRYFINARGLRDNVVYFHTQEAPPAEVYPLAR